MSKYGVMNKSPCIYLENRLIYRVYVTVYNTGALRKRYDVYKIRIKGKVLQYTYL